MAGIRMEYEEDLRVKGLGVNFYSDVSEKWGGLGKYPTPTDYLLISLGTCVLSLMGMKAKAMGFDLTGTLLDVEKILNASGRFEKIILTVDCSRSIDRKTADRLERAAKGCPVHEILSVEQEFVFNWNLFT